MKFALNAGICATTIVTLASPAKGYWGMCPLNLQQFNFSSRVYKARQRLCVIVCTSVEYSVTAAAAVQVQ